MSNENEKVIEEFRASGGKVGGMFEGASPVLLTTISTRTQKPRTNPVVYLADGDRVLVFASNLGAPSHPAWYHNLLANPEVTIEIGDGARIETRTATAHPLLGEERDRLYARQAELVPAFAGYQARTDRVIPVVALYRRDTASARALGDELRQIHDGLRGELATLLTDVETFLAGRPSGAEQPAVGLNRQLRAHCVFFCDALHTHHSAESNLGFPRLAMRFPELAPVLDQLRREHDALAGILRDLRSTLAGARSDEPDKVRAELRRLASELESHFNREEEQLVSALNAL